MVPREDVRVGLRDALQHQFDQLKDVNAHDGLGRVFPMSGDAWGLTGVVGCVVFNKGRKKEVLGFRPEVFVEASYEVRHFPSLTYTGVSPLPADLPRSLYAGGLVLRLGMELPLTAEKKKPEEPPPILPE